MFAPRFRTALRSLPKATTRCLRQQESLPRNFHSTQLRLQRSQGPQRVGSFWRGCKKLYYAHPISFPTGVAAVLAGASLLVYVNYWYVTYIVGAFHTFPEPVAKELRKALYYTNADLNPRLAIRYYKKATEVADEIGFDPFSKEMIGVKIQVAALMEKIEQYQRAIDVLEIVRSDNLAWIDLLGKKEGNEAKRTRVLGTTIQVSVKLADLYSNQYVLEQELAEERLVWAVETALREKKSREERGLKQGEEGEWMSDDELGAAFEELAHLYEGKDQHYLAAPLFLQALTLSPPASCHTAVLSKHPSPFSLLMLTSTVNNLSISLAQQLPPPNYPQNASSRSNLISSAKAWAEKAVKLTAQVKAPERTEECDMGCAVATHNLGELAEMSGDKKEAKRRFEEALSLARGLGFKEGEKNARMALERIKSAEDGSKT